MVVGAKTQHIGFDVRAIISLLADISHHCLIMRWGDEILYLYILIQIREGSVVAPLCRTTPICHLRS
jgi:hypothetical protein